MDRTMAHTGAVGMAGSAARRGRHPLLLTALLVLVLALALGVSAPWRPAHALLLVTVPLRLDPRDDVETLVDSRWSRLYLVNAGAVQAFDTRTGARLYTTNPSIVALQAGVLRQAFVRVPLYTTNPGIASLQGLGEPLPAVDERTGNVYVPNLADDAVTVLDAHGRVRATLHVGHRPDAIALDDRAGRLFVASTADWTLTTLDLRRGRPVQTDTLGVGDVPGQLATDPADGHAVVAGYGGEVALISARTGLVLRQVVPDHLHIVTELAVDARAGRVLGLVEARPDVVVLDARTGAWLRTVRAGQNPTALAVDPLTGRAFIADADAGAVDVLDTRRGAYLLTVPVGPAPLLALDVRRGRVIAASGAGLDVLDARSGALLRHVPLPSDATALAVDERSGHVLVVSVGGTRASPDPWAWLPRPLRRWLPFLPSPRPRIRMTPSVLRILAEQR